MRRLADRLVAHAAAVMTPLRPTQARAMVAELDHVDDVGEALRFALGCVVAAYRQRIGVVLLLAFGARLGTALAAGLLGLIHLLIPLSNLRTKLAMALDPDFMACGPRCASWIRYVAEQSWGYWLWQLAVIGGMGVLHLVAAALLLGGDARRVMWAAAPIAMLAVAMPLLGPGGLTFPIIYLVQIGMMVAMAFGLARLERWDLTRRISA